MLTVQDLIGIEMLKLQCVAGAAGTGRMITWAHTVDLPDPWRWVSPGDLVMTTGIGLPVDAKTQVEWLEQLTQSGASALVIAARSEAPDLTAEMLRTADHLHFPVIQAIFELEFVKLSHFVIESVLQAQRERFNASERLFQTYAEALRSESDMVSRVAILARTLELDLAIEDAISGTLLVETMQPDASGSNHLERIPIGGRSNTNLIIRRSANRLLDDSILIRSLVGLLGVEIEREMIHRDQQREEGSALLLDLLENETDFSLARPTLERKGLKGTLVSLAISPDIAGPWGANDVHQAPALHRLSSLFLNNNGVLQAIVCDEDEMIEVLMKCLGQKAIVGISGPIATATGVRESFRQARLALTQAKEIGSAKLRYGEVDTGLVMAPKSLPEARALVGRYLGSLIEHDRMQNASLLNTLMVFLKNNGNWKATAIDLGIHRQTLVYRLKQVEQMTGVKPTTTEGIARFWIAIQAGKNSQLFE
ncbi:PucR family transcriptional regulator [Pseudomonas putida]|uniref:PucR family transcriptional regulator n=1 Tax=Pseudomonas putida TaxID=303 RepID=UPI00300F6886